MSEEPKVTMTITVDGVEMLRLSKNAYPVSAALGELEEGIREQRLKLTSSAVAPRCAPPCRGCGGSGAVTVTALRWADGSDEPWPDDLPPEVECPQCHGTGEETA